MLKYSVYNDGWQNRLYVARRLLVLVPFLVFLGTFILFAGTVAHSPYAFGQLVTRVAAIALASSIVCVGVYGFYRYHLDHSHGL